MPNFLLDDDLSRDYAAGFQRSEDAAVLDEVKRRRAALQAQKPAKARGGASEVAPAAPKPAGGALAPVSRETPGGAPAGSGGPIEAGNIDLANRPRVKNADGSVSTVLSKSFNIDGQEVLLPTISPTGVKLSDEGALALYRATGQHLGKFATPEEANAAAEQIHNDQASGLADPPWADRAKMRAAMSPETQAQGAGRIGAAVKGVVGGLMESAPQLAGGVLDAFNEAADTLDDIERLVGLDKIDPTVGMERASIGEPKTVMGGFIRSTSQFLTGFLPALKAVKGLSWGSKGLQAIEAGVLANAVVMDPYEQRLSTWLNQVPALAPIVPDYLADNDPEHDGEWESRLKMSIEGALGGAASEGMGKGVLSILKYYKANRAATAEARAAAMTPSEVGAIAAKDAEQQGAVADLVNPLKPDALDGLGDPAGDFYIASDAPTMAEAVATKRVADERLAEAGARADRATSESEFGGLAPDEGVAPNAIDEAFARGEAVDPAALHERMRERRRANASSDNSGVEFLDGNKAVLLWQGDEHAQDILGARAGELAAYQSIESPDRGGMKIWFKSGHEEDARRLLAEMPRGEADAILSKTTEPKVFINHARINAPDDVKALLQAAADSDAEAIAVRTRGVVPNAQTVKEAAKEFQNLEDLIGRRPGPMSAAEAVAARKVLNASGDQLLDLADKAAAEGATPADLFAYRRAQQVHYAIQAEVFGARTEIARALQSWRIPVGTDKMRADQIAELLANDGGSLGAADTVRMAKAIASLRNSPTGLNVFTRDIQIPSKRAAMFELWQASLLTNPPTWALNFLSNAVTGLWAIPERFLAAGISNAFYAGEVKVGEAASMIYAIPKATTDAFRFAARIANDPAAAQAFDAFEKVDRSHQPQFRAEAFGAGADTALGRGIDLIGMAFRGASFEVLGASDRFAKGFNFNLEKAALAFRRANEEGLEGDALALRMRDLEANPPPEVFQGALDVAEDLTFTRGLGKTGQEFYRFINKPMFGVEQLPTWRALVPFYKTPINIMKYAGRRTPLAPIFGQTKRDIQAGGAQAAQAWARVGLSSLVMGAVAKYTMEGVVTGYGPADPDTRRGWLSVNQPYSVRVGDRWYSYRRIEPLGMLFGMAADMAEITGAMSQADAEDMTFAPVVAFAQNFASKTWTRSVIGAMAALDPSNPAGSPGRVVQDLAGSLVPGFVRGIGRAMDPVQRDQNTTADDPIAVEYMGDLPPHVAEFLTETINGYRRQIPGISDNMPARTDIFGRPISGASGLGWLYDYVSPIASKKVGADAVDLVIMQNGIKVAMPERAIRGVPLTGEEYQTYVELAGGPAKKYLDKLVGSAGFSKLSGGPDGMASTLVKEVISKYRQNAANQMFIRFPQIRARWLANEQRKQQQLIGAQ